VIRVSTKGKRDVFPARNSYRWSPKEQSVILLCTIKVRSPHIARQGLDTLLERQNIPDHLPDTVRVCQTDALGFRNQEMFEQLTNAFESEPCRT
jgi:hypothetical protein